MCIISLQKQIFIKNLKYKMARIYKHLFPMSNIPYCFIGLAWGLCKKKIYDKYIKLSVWNESVNLHIIYAHNWMRDIT